jgi:hypothetical protein
MSAYEVSDVWSQAVRFSFHRSPPASTAFSLLCALTTRVVTLPPTASLASYSDLVQAITLPDSLFRGLGAHGCWVHLWSLASRKVRQDMRDGDEGTIHPFSREECYKTLHRLPEYASFFGVEDYLSLILFVHHFLFGHFRRGAPWMFLYCLAIAAFRAMDSESEVRLPSFWSGEGVSASELVRNNGVTRCACTLFYSIYAFRLHSGLQLAEVHKCGSRRCHSGRCSLRKGLPCARPQDIFRTGSTLSALLPARGTKGSRSPGPQVGPSTATV